jgi:hypothetical protein
MELQIGRYAATRQTWRSKTVRELLTEIIAANPVASETLLRREFKEAVRGDEDYFAAVTDYAFDNAMRAIEVAKEHKPLSAEDRAERARKTAKTLEDHAKQVKSVKEQIITLNLEMPNGKRLRYCTLDYLYRLGGCYKAAGKKGSQKRVGEIYNEEQFRAKLKDLT